MTRVAVPEYDQEKLEEGCFRRGLGGVGEAYAGALRRLPAEDGPV